jgi:23S rRNA (guanine745-N1)-methyltransferase
VALSLGASAATCAAGHSFDRARSGYLNLLLSTQRHSPEPGDSPEMLRSRRAILQAGVYDAMSDAVNAAVQQALGDRSEARIADLGCGEGFFLGRLKRHLGQHQYFGVDISRAGVKMATAYDRSITWMVASLHDSPFLPGSLDVALSTFAPLAPADVRRVLRPDGFLITATPGPDHLDALRAIIYASVVPHAPAPAVIADDPTFTLVHSTRARATAAVHSQESVMHLLAMTPFYWNISLDTKARVEACESLEFTVDVNVNVYRRGDE